MNLNMLLQRIHGSSDFFFSAPLHETIAHITLSRILLQGLCQLSWPARVVLSYENTVCVSRYANSSYGLMFLDFSSDMIVPDPAPNRVRCIAKHMHGSGSVSSLLIFTLLMMLLQRFYLNHNL